MNNINYTIFVLIISMVLQSCDTNISQISYLDQNLPDNKPKLFSTNIVNTDSIEINSVFNSSFTELFFTRIINGSFVIHNSELIDGEWTNPKPIQMFNNKIDKSVAIDPTITKDGRRMYFLGISPDDYSKKQKPDIYRSEKVNGKWQIASKVEAPISTMEYAESYPVVVADGSLYFTSDRPGGYGKRDLYRAQYLGNGNFDTPKNIGPAINSERSARGTFVSADETYLITSNITDEKGFFVSFNSNNEWQKPIHFELGEPIEKDWIYFCPYMSPDNKYFFFSKRLSNPPESGWRGVTKGNVYWVDASNIMKLDQN